MTDNPKQTIRDHAAARALGSLLLASAQQLAPLDDEPILIIAYPHKFNDAGNDDYWCAVQIGLSYWEASQFYRYEYLNGDEPSGEPCHRGGSKQHKEYAAYFTDNSKEGQKNKEEVKRALKKARNILKDLEGTNWRDLARDALGEDQICGLGLYLFKGAVWLINSQYYGSDEGTIWYCSESGTLFYFAEIWRSTTGIGEAEPVRFGEIDPDALGKLEGGVRNWYFPIAPTLASKKRYKSLIELSSMIGKTSGAIRAATTEPVTISSVRVKRTDWYPTIEIWWNGSAFHRSQGGKFLYDRDLRSHAAIVKAYQESEPYEKAPKIVNLAGEKLDYLELNGWRDLFSCAFSSTLQTHEQLHLLITNNNSILLRGNTIFKIQEGLLHPAGYVDDATIHSFVFEHVDHSIDLSIFATSDSNELN